MTIVNPVLYKIITFVFLLPFMFSIASATEVIKGENKHARVWNKFANDCLSLHKKLTDGKDLQVKERVDRYINKDVFFTEYRYFDEGRLISQIQWENGDQSKLHNIEVYMHDEKGRVVRDYISAYLPFYHDTPIQALISFHHYNADLHAFRSFDASGDTVLERCSGRNKKGQPVDFILDEDDLYNDYDGIMESGDYNECFAGLKQNKLGKYIIPQ
jgi:hypothetical protein